MSPDTDDDPVLAALHELHACDVSAARAQRLRARCQTYLKTQGVSRHLPLTSRAGVWRALRALAAAWCVVYLVETLRRAAAVYGL
jgi:hypothetical protein